MQLEENVHRCGQYFPNSPSVFKTTTYSPTVLQESKVTGCCNNLETHGTNESNPNPCILNGTVQYHNTDIRTKLSFLENIFIHLGHKISSSTHPRSSFSVKVYLHKHY